MADAEAQALSALMHSEFTSLSVFLNIVSEFHFNKALQTAHFKGIIIALTV